MPSAKNQNDDQEPSGSFTVAVLLWIVIAIFCSVAANTIIASLL